MVKLLSALISLTLAACAYDASFSDCTIHCSATSGCPDGLTCGGEGLCRSAGVSATCNAILADAGPDARFASCNGLAATCGPNASDDCCATATTIPGGTFFRSYDVAADGMYPSTSYPATISPFVLDKYEVTVGRFRKFVEAGQGTQASPPIAGTGAHAKIPGSGWDASWNGDLAADTATLKINAKCDSTYQTWTDAAGANENLPMNCITWYEAMTFCIWDGGYLPTEAEWNFAAAGGSEQRAYPWSNPASSTTIDCSYANYDINVPSGTFCVNGTTGATNRVGSESPKDDGKWGQSDLAGNVWEWALDWNASSYSATCTDCADLTAGSIRTVRGGGFNVIANYVRVAYHLNGGPPINRYGLVGVRCARSMLLP